MDLELQLRAAEARRADLERQHGDALSALRGCGADTLEARQSRVRELEKKVALETVRSVKMILFHSSRMMRSTKAISPYRCEELQLELASSHRNRSNTCVTTCVPQMITTNAMSTGQNWGGNKGNDIERIMAKIEQDNRILAELDHSRSTTLGKLNRVAKSLWQSSIVSF